MRCIDWVAPAASTPAGVLSAIEMAVPGLKLYHRGDNVVHGYLNTSRRPDGSLYVCVCLYNTPCSNVNCPTGHGAIQFLMASVTPAHLLAMRTAVGEHPSHILGEGRDNEVLTGLGFAEQDGPRVSR